mmetsp:Transcript_164718/g.528436  ORF Transcript_164718/g.528436 Transcript_164718/m.528436 type:complete len:239 (+) Transcript_164718:317-1033(+)
MLPIRRCVGDRHTRQRRRSARRVARAFVRQPCPKIQAVGIRSDGEAGRLPSLEAILQKLQLKPGDASPGLLPRSEMQQLPLKQLRGLLSTQLAMQLFGPRPCDPQGLEQQVHREVRIPQGLDSRGLMIGALLLQGRQSIPEQDRVHQLVVSQAFALGPRGPQLPQPVPQLAPTELPQRLARHRRPQFVVQPVLRFLRLDPPLPRTPDQVARCRDHRPHRAGRGSDELPGRRQPPARCG